MAKKQDLVRVGHDGPSFLTPYVEADTSVETLKEHRVLNRLAVIQSNSPREVKEKFGEGSLAIPASEAVVVKIDERVEFVPVFFFDEYVTWADRDDSAGPMILERSTDATSELAQKAGDFDRMREKYGEPDNDGELPFTMRHCHHLNFAGMLYSGDLSGTPIVVTFSRGDFKKGRSFISAILMRKVDGKQAPLWATRWQLYSEPRKNDKGEWYGIGFSNAEDPWIKESDAESLKLLHEEMKEFYEAQRLSVAHEAAEIEEDEEGEKRF
jgi:hypothetical protein